MKKLILKSFLLSLPFVFFTMFIYAIDPYILKRAIKKDTHIIILGDSHAQSGIYDALIPNSLNIAQSSETYFFSYYKIKKIVKFHKIDTLIISYSPHNISYYEDDKNIETYPSKILYPRYLSCLGYEGISYFMKNSKTNLLAIIPNYLKTSILSYIHKRNVYVGVFKLSYKNKLSDKATNEKVKGHFYNKNGLPQKISQSQLLYLNKIIALCSANKIKVVLVNLPVYYKYKRQIPKKFLNYYYNSLNSICKNSNVSFYDFSSLKFPDYGFGDQDHINTYGAAIVTPEIKKRMAENEN